MKTLLAFFYHHFDFLYLDPGYRIVDSRTRGLTEVDAGLTLMGPVVSVSLTNNRGVIGCAVAPNRDSRADNWFRMSIMRLFLDGTDEDGAVTPVEQVAWLRENIVRIEALFTEDSAGESCERIAALEVAASQQQFGCVRSTPEGRP